MKTNHLKQRTDPIKPAADNELLVSSIPDFRRVLVPIDFSEMSVEALKYAVRFAKKFGAELTLVFVLEPAPFMVDMENNPLALSDQQAIVKAQTRLELLASAQNSPEPIKVLVRQGKPFRAIVEVAEELDTELIILPTHGHTGLSHVLLGSVAEKVAEHAPCAVLILRKHDQ